MKHILVLISLALLLSAERVLPLEVHRWQLNLIGPSFDHGRDFEVIEILFLLDRARMRQQFWVRHSIRA